MKYLILGYILICCTGCDKDVLPPVGEGNSYKLITAEATNITQNTVTLINTLNSVPGAPAVSSRGVCWDSIPTPTVLKSIITSGAGTGNFPINLAGLQAGKRYYARGFFKVLDIVYYGNEITFTTFPATLAMVSISSISGITRNSASVACSNSSAGGGIIKEKGVCWSVAANPTVDDNKISGGTGTGAYSVALSGLSPATTYYVRAYAINEAGIVYSSSLTLRTAT